MATVAVGRRERAVVARSTADRALLRSFLERDRLYAAYAICDLEEREFPRTKWGLATAGDEPIAVAMEYSGLTLQPLFVMGRPDGIGAILRDVSRPRAAYVAARREWLSAVETLYRVDPGPPMVRMWVDRARFRPYPSDVRRLLPVEIGELNRLYQLGFASWLSSSAIAEGVYYGIRVGGRLVAAAGTGFYPAFMGPAWLGYYWRDRKARYRFIGACLVVSIALLGFVYALSRPADGLSTMGTFLRDSFGHHTDPQGYGSSPFGFWGQKGGIRQAIMTPLLSSPLTSAAWLAVFALIGGSGLLARGRSPAALALLSGAIAMAATLVKPHASGTYMAWYYGLILIGICAGHRFTGQNGKDGDRLRN